MKKTLGIFASLLFFSTMALVQVGCSSNKCCDDQPVCEQPCQPVCEPAKMYCPPPPVCAPVCPPKCAPVCPPACPPVCPPKCPPVCAPACPPACPPVCAPQPMCPPEPFCKAPVRCRYPTSNELNCRDGISVYAKNPRMCMLGEQYPLEFEIKACDDVCDVVVNTTLPEGVSYIRSEPEAKVDGSKLTWNIGHMSKCDVIPAKVWVRCECEGDQCACFCATATPVRFCSLLCAKPVLTCEKCGPLEACPGDAVNYTVSIANHGSCAAEDVVVTDTLPEGINHCSGLRTLVYKIGNLEPCQVKQVSISAVAAKRGKQCNTVVVSACNADSVSCQCCTNVCQECVELTKVGPKEQQIGKNADYQITVTNTGDKSLTQVVVTDNAPNSTSIVAANGATINGNQAIWKVKELKPGEKANFTLTLTTCVPGCFTNRVGVTDCQGCNACAEATTRWKGRPALNLCVTNTENPVCIGEQTSYNVSVVNQGSEADKNVVVTVRFPAEVSPVSAMGDSEGTVSGQVVTFGPYKSLAPRQTLSYRVDARAKASGDARIVVEVTSDSAKTAIVQQESTIVN